ncbi:hypothetical protein POSPLADRAFT_1134329 [Postia placenta MAD-698-R-SB12]|uniref:Uncharacterized protein n=1 Tax=Postia placenta MAD-698-R-SB12 TaxID=670580 RepID=A0A1X6N9G8_9APHY|nr:hypothetical protein POSPLADRAFT_1134329 [Postia placenta MAD-698-R-SB12]OSX65251.1 hypothetical protein POSPLADRAFT_1134329 [Postia placenta MAD-698-R-SB12]
MADAKQFRNPCEMIPLSPALLRQIFECGTKIEVKEDRVKFSHRVASVCRTWRDVANGTPTLWSTVHIALGREHALLSLEKSLERSRSQPLEISIAQGPCEDEEEPNAIRQAMDLLMPHMKRWRTVHIDVFSVETVVAAVGKWNGSADALEEIFLGTTGEQLDEDDLAIFALNPTFSAPNLHLCVVYDLYCTSEGPRLPKIFPAMQDLSIVRTGFKDVTTSAQYLKVLEPLRSLRSLNLFEPDLDQGGADDNAVEGGQVSLPALVELELQSISYNTLDRFLAALDAPSLATLSLSRCNDLDMNSLPHIRDQLARFPSLDTLRLFRNTLKMEHISDIFGSLRCFCLVSISLTELFSSLKPKLKRGWYLPRLTAMEIHCEKGVPLTLLGQVVDVRHAGAASEQADDAPRAIQDITVYTKDPISEEDRLWFESKVRTFVWLDTDLYKGTDVGATKLICAVPD